jgi:hypothetical protein
MTQEDKELLCKDLSARVLYGVKLSVKDGVEVLRGVEVIDGCFDTNIVYYCEHSLYDSKYIKPYLFPLSSMTEEQKKEYHDKYCLSDYYALEKFDWFNKNHLDYRGLIEKGLAIDATNLNIY